MTADPAASGAAPATVADITEIAMPDVLYAQLVDHGRRKLLGLWVEGEEQAPKAYGLVGGRISGPRVELTHVLPLRNNLRSRPDFKGQVDHLMAEMAVPSETPMDRRGWVADPREVMAADWACEAAGSTLFGAYHMHRVPWPDDPLRDACTDLDRGLAEGSGLWALILSMVDPERPRLRAFFEGSNDQEAVIRVGGGDP